VILSLISGIFVPIDQLPNGLEAIARVFPVYHLAEGLQMALGKGGVGTLSGNDLLSARRFRWEPHTVAAQRLHRIFGPAAVRSLKDSAPAPEERDMTRALGSASSMLRSAALAAAFAGLYFLTTQLTGWIVGDPAVLWPASGVYLGVMLVAPRHRWPVLACGAGVGSLVTYLHGGASLELSIAFAVPSSAEGLLAAVLIERMAGARFTLAGMRELSALVVGGAVVANGLVALSVGAVAVRSFDASFTESWLRWWSADALGMIAVVPILTARSRGLRTAALAGLGVALVATHVTAEVYAIQGFLAVLLLASLAYTAATRDRERVRDDLGRSKEELGGSAERLERAGRRIAQLQAELVARKGEVQKVTRQKEHLAADVRDAQAAQERTERELAGAREELSRVSDENGALEDELSRAGTQNGALEEALSRVSARTGALAAELARANEANGALEDELSRASAGNGALEDELSRVSARNGALEEELSHAGERTAALEEEVSRVSTQNGALEDATSRISARYSALKEELSRANEANGALEEELSRASEANGALEGELSRANAANGALEEELSRVSARNGALEEELSRVGAHVGVLEEELLRAKSELAEAVSERDRAEQELGADRPDDVRSELEQSQRAQAEAEQALERARALLLDERARREEALDEITATLARTEAERRLLAEHASELIARYDERGTCLYASPAARRLLGYEPGELVSRPGAELLHPEDRHLLARARAMRAESTFQARLRRKTGEYIWVEVRLRPVLAHDGDRVVAVTTAIREISRDRDLAAA
jgi:PAS domain S-box-containing protein